MRNRPQLITYVDRLAGNLTNLHALLTGPLDGVFGGVHLLPFFHPIDGADAGFDPIDHTKVDPRLGTWDDVGRIGADYDVMADLIVNHVSSHSSQFDDWQRRGVDSPYDGMFLTHRSVFPDGATEDELVIVYRPRPGLPFTLGSVAGRPRLLWTTFTSEQIDVDVGHRETWAYLTGILDTFAGAGIDLVRLDAVGYAVKRAGTTCFMIPETFEFIDRLERECRTREITMIVEIHGHYRTQVEIAERVDLVYDYALPPLVLDAIFTADAGPLKEWIRIRPNNCITVLDTHDGIGVVDIGADPNRPDRPGLLPDDRVTALVERIHTESGGASRSATGAAASNLDLYQVNCTFFDALGGDDARHRMARLIQVLLPGVPQIYYVGMLNGANDMKLLERTGVGRDINRHHYSPDELAAALRRPAVRELLALYSWRGADPVFDGTFTLLDTPNDRLGIRWSAGDRSFEAELRLDDLTFRCTIGDGDRTQTHGDLEFCR